MITRHGHKSLVMVTSHKSWSQVILNILVTGIDTGTCPGTGTLVMIRYSHKHTKWSQVMVTSHIEYLSHRHRYRYSPGTGAVQVQVQVHWS